MDDTGEGGGGRGEQLQITNAVLELFPFFCPCGLGIIKLGLELLAEGGELALFFQLGVFAIL